MKANHQNDRLEYQLLSETQLTITIHLNQLDAVAHQLQTIQNDYQSETKPYLAIVDAGIAVQLALKVIMNNKFSANNLNKKRNNKK